MNKLGILFAMDEELNELKKYILFEEEYNLFDLKFYQGIIGNKKCVITKCGVGKVNAARATQIMIDNMDVDCIINVGVAGGVDNSINVGDIIIGEKLVQHDFDITAFNHEKGYIPELNDKYIYSDEYLLNVAKKTFKEDFIKYGVIASGDIFCTDEKMSKKINGKFNALCTEMEGASIAQVCFLCHIPFLIFRCISDVVGKENKQTYEAFLEKSSKIASEYIVKLIENLC